MFSVKGGGIAFVDRGDPDAYDFTTGDFTYDNNYQDIDLSGIVGAKACLVLIGLRIKCATTTEYLYWREKGNSNEFNVVHRQIKTANVFINYEVWVQTDATGKIEFKATPGTYTNMDFVVKGWLA